MIRVQFSLRTVFVVMTACAMVLAWWSPAETDVRCADIYFILWRPKGPNLRITTERRLYELLERPAGPGISYFLGIDFSKSDVVQVPLNGVAGELAAEFRVPALGKPVDLDFRNTPLRKVVEVLANQCEIDLQCDSLEFHSARTNLEMPMTFKSPLLPSFVPGASVNPEMPVTFKARGIALRDALRSMLEPRGLTFVVAQGGDSVVITTESAAQTAYVLSGKMRFPLFDYFPGRRVVGRPRFRGALVLLTPSFYPAEPDSRTVGYTVPKGAKVLFVSECVASAMDAGYTLIVLLMAAALIAYPKWLPGHRRRS